MMTHAQKLTLKSALVAGAMLAFTAGAHAQTPPAYGHWEGVIDSQIGSQAFEIDLGAGPDGKLTAALTIDAENVRGLPLSNVAISGGKVSFELPGGDAGKFTGALAEDGKSINGVLDKGFGQAQFAMTRTGEARFAEAPKNPVIAKQYEGEWSGTLDMGGRETPLSIVLANKGGAGVGQLAVAKGAAIPLVIRQAQDTVTLELASTGEAITVGLAADGSLTGAF